MYSYVVEIKVAVETEDPLSIGEIANEYAELLWTERGEIPKLHCHWYEGNLDDLEATFDDGNG